MPAANGEQRVIEEIVLQITLPTISTEEPAVPEQLPEEIASGDTAPGTSGVYGEDGADDDVDSQESAEDSIPSDAKREKKSTVKPGTSKGTIGTVSVVDITKELSEDKVGRLPAMPQPPKISVIKLDELDMDAPPDYDEIKMNLMSVPQNVQVIMMDMETDAGSKDTKNDGIKNAADEQKTSAGQTTMQMPGNVQKIYTVDPQVIKRLQWRIARIEDFQTSLGLAVAEIKESIAKAETTRLELEEMRKGYAAVEKTMHELAALYDLISASVNPFVDSEQEQQTISTKIMKRTLGMENVTGGSTEFPVSQSSAGLAGGYGNGHSASLDLKQQKTSAGREDYSVDTWTVKWAEFLLERIPKSKIGALLDHYIEIGWLDEAIKSRVEDTIKGIDEINLGIHATETESGENDDERTKLDWWKLPIDDHVKSLQFIEKIRGTKIK